jgi:hypothetical protein
VRAAWSSSYLTDVELKKKAACWLSITRPQLRHRLAQRFHEGTFLSVAPGTPTVSPRGTSGSYGLRFSTLIESGTRCFDGQQTWHFR